MNRIIVSFVVGAGVGFVGPVLLGLLLFAVTMPTGLFKGVCDDLPDDVLCVQVPSRELEAGKKIRSRHLQSVAIPTQFIPDNALTDGGVGRTTDVLILEGEFVRPERLK